MNGLEVQDWLVKSGNTVPVIFITGHDEVGVRDKALAAGQWGVLRVVGRGDNEEIIARNEQTKRLQQIDCRRRGTD